MEVKTTTKKIQKQPDNEAKKKRGGAGDKNIDKNTVLKTAYSQSNEIKRRTKLILLPLVMRIYFYRYVLSVNNLYCLNKCFLYSCSENKLARA